MGINNLVRGMCSKEEVMFVDVYDHFTNDKSILAKEALHLNCAGKVRLGMV